LLKSFKVVGQEAPSRESEEYMEIYKKLEPYQQPIWTIEILLILLLTTTWLVGCTSDYPLISIAAFAFTQILAGWCGHSAAHSRNKNLNRCGLLYSSLFGGFSIEWWSPKHNMHHMFTNIEKYDQDIQHDYKVYLFEFLYLKWRFDSLVTALASVNMVPPVRFSPKSSSS
jgi:fatty acid desaturase